MRVSLRKYEKKKLGNLSTKFHTRGLRPEVLAGRPLTLTQKVDLFFPLKNSTPSTYKEYVYLVTESRLGSNKLK